MFSRFILDKKIGIGQPKRIENAKILVANTAMDTDKVKIYGARVRVDSMSKVADIEAAEKQKMREKVQKIIAHGINCFVNRQLIYNFPEELFADAGILAIEHADFEGIERLVMAVTSGGTADDIASRGCEELGTGPPAGDARGPELPRHSRRGCVSGAARSRHGEVPSRQWMRRKKEVRPGSQAGCFCGVVFAGLARQHRSRQVLASVPLHF
jgi:chaperonin GroEL (HSP60 family)